MEDYLSYMKTLRSQMNEVEDQAAKITVEEQMHFTTIHNMEKDLEFVKNETRQLKEETERLMILKGNICSEILEKQRKITSLGFDASTLSQTLDLIQNESDALSTKISVKRTCYAKTIEDINSGLKEQQRWLNTVQIGFSLGEEGKTTNMEEMSGGTTGTTEESKGNIMKSMMRLDAANAELGQIKIMKNNLISEHKEMKQAMELTKSKINHFNPELQKLDSKVLEEELQALLSDKAGESEYLQSLQLQIRDLKGIQQSVTCSCGEEYIVGLGPCE